MASVLGINITCKEKCEGRIRQQVQGEVVPQKEKQVLKCLCSQQWIIKPTLIEKQRKKNGTGEAGEEYTSVSTA